jgi:anti-sigma factor RsiW
MTNCDNETMRDLLPLLAHDALDGEEANAVRAHVATCDACAAELQAITAAATLFAAATPTIDTAAILAKLPAAPTARPALRLEPAAKSSRSTFRMPRYALAAAASVMLMVTLSLPVLRPIFFGATAGVDTTVVSTGVVDSATPATAPSVPATVEPVASLGGTELKDLGVDELTQLLSELDQMEATIAAEPRSMRDPITTSPEGM